MEASRPTENPLKESQVAFLWDWLGTTGKRALKGNKWSTSYKDNIDTIFDKSEQK